MTSARIPRPSAIFALSTIPILALAGCRSATKENKAAARERGVQASTLAPPNDYLIQPGDTVSVRFALNPEFDSQLPVRPDGRFSLPLLGDIEVARTTPAQLRSRLMEAYKPHLRHPDLTVNIIAFASTVAYVGGEVRNPGVISIAVPTSALQAIISVGGQLGSGDMRNVVIVRDRGTPEPEIMMLDLTRGLETLAAHQDLRLQARDMVFVPRTGISQANQFVREYIRDMLPIQSSFSVQYQFSDFALP